jgi:hypothetical protein
MVCLLASNEAAPNPTSDCIIAFVDFFNCILGFPHYQFVKWVLEIYLIEQVNLKPNLISFMMIFPNLSEAWFGRRPSPQLYRYFY